MSKYTIEDLRDSYPHRVPLKIKPSLNCPKNLKLEKKYLVPKETTLIEFLHILRKQLKLENHQALLLYIKDELPPINKTVEELDNYYKFTSGILEVVYTAENTFG
jgi:GABA(A) receptor-associated protein